MKTKEVNIKWMDEETERTFGPIVLKKMSFKEKCDFKGKIVQINIKQVNGIAKEEKNIDTGALFFWTVVYSIHSLPKHPNFSTLTEEKKADIVSYLGYGDDEPENLGEALFEEASQLNPLTNQTELKKK
jgi:hypothetical protein